MVIQFPMNRLMEDFLEAEQYRIYYEEEDSYLYDDYYKNGQKKETFLRKLARKIFAS